MLRREQAEEQLKAFQETPPERAQLARVRKLPASLRQVAFGLLGCAADGADFADYRQSEPARAEAAAALDRLPAKERRAVLDALFARLAPAVEGGWELFARLPYQAHMGRRAFRTPGHPEVSRPARTAWLCG